MLHRCDITLNYIDRTCAWHLDANGKESATRICFGSIEMKWGSRKYCGADKQ
jgi:hypothetical protein